MNNKKDSFLVGRIKSVKYALRGIRLLITTEPNIKIQVVIAVVITLVGFVMQLSATEWVLQFLTIGLVLVAESVNTAIEKLADFIHKDYHKDIGFIKDIAAGAPAIAAIIAIIVGCIIYIPKFY